MFSFTMSRLRSVVPFRVFTILSNGDRNKLLVFVAVNFMLSLLDVICVGLIGIIIKIATIGDNPVGLGSFISQILSRLRISDQSLNTQLVFLGILVSFILVVKMFAVLALLRKINVFMSRISAEASGHLVLKLLSTSLLQLQARSMQESLWLLTQGVTTVFIEVAAVLVIMLGDFMLITLMISMLYIVNPFIALSTLSAFGLVGVILFAILKRRAFLNGKLLAAQQVSSNQEIYEVLESFRETYVKNRRYYYAEQVRTSRIALAKSLAIRSYLPNVSKYVFETAVTLGILIFAAVQFSTVDKATAITALGLFLGASSRIAPSVMRLQQNALILKGSSGIAVQVFELIDELKLVVPIGPVSDSIDLEHKDFEAKISVRNVSFKYPGSNNFALNNISLDLEPNKVYAVVGPSGAGKTTLIDVILGIITPDQGTVEISGVSPNIAIQTWPGAMAYLPQNIATISASISENVSVGYPPNMVKSELISDAIEIAQLSDFVRDLPLGIDTNVGDRGTKLSGGQRQRLGIARALYTKPKLLFLDEATSALDGQTEDLVSDAILGQEGLTVITIAHRLSTIRKADCLIYVNHGIIEAVGSLEDVRKIVYEFDQQIKLMKT